MDSDVAKSETVKSLITDSFTSSTLSAMNVSKTDYPQVEVKKRINEFNAEVIYDAVQKYKISDVNLSNLQKLHERELINVPFFQKLRKVFNPQMIKSHLMEVLGISKSYTGFHEYIKGDREDIPNAGLCNIAKKVGYNVLIIPVPENISDAEYRSLCAYRDGFIIAVEKRIQEGNVPVTRAKSKGGEKPKYVNNDLLNGLALDSERIMDSINIGAIAEEDKIGADDVFQDTSGPLEFEDVIQTVQQMGDEDIDSFKSLGSISTTDFSNLVDLGNMNNIGMFDEAMSLEEPFIEKEDNKPLVTDMSGFVDTFDGFKSLGDLDDMDIMEQAVLAEKNEK